MCYKCLFHFSNTSLCFCFRLNSFALFVRGISIEISSNSMRWRFFIYEIVKASSLSWLTLLLWENNMKFCIFLFVRFCNHILNWFWIMVISLICLVCHQMIFSSYDIGHGSHLTTPEYLYIVLSFSIKIYSEWVIFFL